MMGKRRLVALACVALACAGAAAVGHASAPARAVAATSGCSNSPAVYPESQVAAGLTGTGKTVVSGTTPSSFDVQVLGVLADGVAPGIDMYVVKLSGPVMDQTGGGFEGISGSPVYVNGKLLGSVSYALSTDRTIAGLTPAQPIVDLFGYPRAGSAATARTPKMTARVALTPSVRTAVASASHVTGAAAGSLGVLRTPVGVSGLTDAGLQRLQTIFNRHHLPYTAFHGGAAASPTSVSGPAIVAGGNFAATQSFGDLTFYGLGTATAVCGDEVVAFGHPFDLQGPVSLGMNNADTIAIIPEDPFGAYKLANITGLRGMVDQDRLAGVRGITSELPQVTRVDSTVHNSDLGTTKSGRTDVADQQMMSLIAQFAVYVENVVGFDREASGSEAMTWTITGSFQGQPFTLTRADSAWSSFDVPFDSTNELTGELGALQFSKFGPAQITGVRFGGTITQAQHTATITRVESRSQVQPQFGVRNVLRVLPGGTVDLRVTLTHPDGTTSVSPLTLEVPARFRGGPLAVRGGRPPSGCPYCAFGETFSTSATTFAGLVQSFQNGEHATDLVGSLLSGVKTSVAKPNVILGGRTIFLTVG
jgi:SpoIVB peptidase S55